MTADATLLVLRYRLIVDNVTVNALILTEVALVGLLWNVYDTRSISAQWAQIGWRRAPNTSSHLVET